MIMCYLRLVGLVSFGLATFSSPVFAQETSKKPRVLMVTQSKGFQHGSVKRGKEKEQLSPSEVAMIQLGQTTGLFSVDCTQEADKDFTIDNLKKYNIVCFYTTGDLPIAPETRDFFFNDWLKPKG